MKVGVWNMRDSLQLAEPDLAAQQFEILLAL